MVKNSFTIFEVLISTLLLSFVIVGFSQNSYYENFDEEYQLLNNLENSFNTNSYDSNFKKNTSNLKIIKNDLEEETLLVNKIEYKDEKVHLIKYEIR